MNSADAFRIELYSYFIVHFNYKNTFFYYILCHWFYRNCKKKNDIVTSVFFPTELNNRWKWKNNPCEGSHFFRVVLFLFERDLHFLYFFVLLLKKIKLVLIECKQRAQLKMYINVSENNSMK